MVTATFDNNEIKVEGVTHEGTVPLHYRWVYRRATRDHRWVIVRTAGLWTLVSPGVTEYKTFPGSLTVHRLSRCEAAAHAEAATLPGGRVIAVE